MGELCKGKRFKITANAICPGTILTDINRKELSNSKKRNDIIEKTPLKRLGYPDDVTGAVLFLASTDADFINGATIAIDGGFTAIEQ